MKLIIVHFPLITCLLFPLKPRYLPQHCIHEHSQSFFSLDMRGQVLHTQNSRKNYISVYCNLYIFRKPMGRQIFWTEW